MSHVSSAAAVLLFQVRDAYISYMKKVAKYLGGGPDSDEQMMKVFEFETKLAKVRKQITSNKNYMFNYFLRYLELG